MTTADSLNHDYVAKEQAAFNSLYEREKWYLGEILGYNPETSPEGRERLQDRMLLVILNGFGEWIAKQSHHND